MTQAGLANLAAFGFSVLGLFVGVAFGGVGAVPLSILFGFVGYVGTRWLTGVVYDKVRQRIRSVSKYNLREFHYENFPSCSGKGYRQMNRQISTMSVALTRIRRENAIHQLRTDLRHLQMKANSLQRQTSTVIGEVRNFMCIISYFGLIITILIRFVYLYTPLWKIVLGCKKQNSSSRTI